MAMEPVWRFRLMLITALALIMFGDFFGYGSIKVIKSATGSRSTTPFREKSPKIEINGETTITDLSLKQIEIQRQNKFVKEKLSEVIRDACLPKMLCELASRPEYTKSDKEKDLLNMIRSTSIPLIMNSPPIRWHFATHMGELLQHTSDSLSGTIGCANLWPHCPFSSKKLLSLRYRIDLK